MWACGKVPPTLIYVDYIYRFPIKSSAIKFKSSISNHAMESSTDKLSIIIMIGQSKVQHIWSCHIFNLPWCLSKLLWPWKRGFLEIFVKNLNKSWKKIVWLLMQFSYMVWSNNQVGYTLTFINFLPGSSEVRRQIHITAASTLFLTIVITCSYNLQSMYLNSRHTLVPPACIWDILFKILCVILLNHLTWTEYETWTRSTSHGLPKFSQKSGCSCWKPSLIFWRNNPYWYRKPYLKNISQLKHLEIFVSCLCDMFLFQWLIIPPSR